jgi:hypothetical protein
MTGQDRLDAILARHFRSGAGASDAADVEAAARVMAALARPLPAQQRGWRLWPKELLDWNFAPAWPRLAALGACALVGFAVGTATPALRDHHRAVAVAQQDEALDTMLSEPEPLTGVLP